MNNYQWLLQMDGADRKAWFDAEHVETEERALDGDTAPENEDSRERLEAEIESYSAFDMMDTITLDMVIGWLDRQASITEREHPGLTISDDESLINWRGRNYLPQSRALNAERERDEFSLKLKHEMELNRDNRNAHDLEQIAELIAERDNWKANCEDWKKDCERYRNKFGKCLDYADAIHALMDEGMA